MAVRKPGRPKGKRSSIEYTRLTAYITKRSYRKLKAVAAYKDLEVSQAIQQAVDKWLSEQGIQFPDEEEQQ